MRLTRKTGETKPETKPDIMERMVAPTPSTFPETPSDSLREMVWWMYDATCIGLGAERQFDYADDALGLDHRLGRCYELAAKAFTGWEMFNTYRGSHDSNLPAPTTLVHGTWQGPEPVRIGHAWVVLADGRIWEPITALICDPVLFHAYSRDEEERTYGATRTRVHMIRSGHFGPWH